MGLPRHHPPLAHTSQARMPCPSLLRRRAGVSALCAHTHTKTTLCTQKTLLSPPLSQAFTPLHSPVPEALYPTLSVGLTSVGLAAAAGFFVCVGVEWGMERERSRESRSGREKKPERAHLRALNLARLSPSLYRYEVVRPKPARRLAEEAGLAVASSLALVSWDREGKAGSRAAFALPGGGRARAGALLTHAPLLLPPPCRALAPFSPCCGRACTCDAGIRGARFFCL